VDTQNVIVLLDLRKRTVVTTARMPMTLKKPNFNVIANTLPVLSTEYPGI